MACWRRNANCAGVALDVGGNCTRSLPLDGVTLSTTRRNRAISSPLSEAPGEGARAVHCVDTAAVLGDGIELDALCVGAVLSPSRRKGRVSLAARGNTGPDPGGINRCGRFRVDVLADEPSANVLLPVDVRVLGPP